MADTNVGLSVTDPDRLLDGTHPAAPFIVKYIQLYRWATEALGRAGSAGAGTLVTTFTVLASTAAPADPNITGPFRYRVYDADQVAGSCYRYRFADVDVTSFSAFSDMWMVGTRAGAGLALRDALYEMATPLGKSIERGTAAANTDAGLVNCSALFESSFKDAKLWEGAWLMCVKDAAGLGAAPEGEEAQIVSVDPATGIATLERDLSAAITTGDTIIVSYWLQPTELVDALNKAREKMMVLSTIDLALSVAEDRYPAPYGVRSEDDVVSAVGIRQFTNSNREDEWPIDYRVVEESGEFFIEITENPGVSPVARLRCIRSYRDVEGALSAMGDTTNAPVAWLRAAAAYEAANVLMEGDPGEVDYQRLAALRKADMVSATERFAPKRPPKHLKKGLGRAMLPGPVEVR